MPSFALFVLLALFCANFLLAYRSWRKIERRRPLERLKNALLTLALVTAQKDAIQDLPIVNYDALDGTKLPALAGSSMAHACYSYILSPRDESQHRFRNPIMVAKGRAIERCLDKNLDSDAKAYALFERFVQTRAADPAAESAAAATGEENPKKE
jgi:hypothetical protein